MLREDGPFIDDDVRSAQFGEGLFNHETNPRRPAHRGEVSLDCVHPLIVGNRIPKRSLSTTNHPVLAVLLLEGDWFDLLGER